MYLKFAELKLIGTAMQLPPKTLCTAGGGAVAGAMVWGELSLWVSAAVVGQVQHRQ
jgi:hypothetical protein